MVESRSYDPVVEMATLKTATINRIIRLKSLSQLKFFLTYVRCKTSIIRKIETVSMKRQEMTIQLETVKSKLIRRKKNWTVSETPRNVSRENITHYYHRKSRTHNVGLSRMSKYYHGIIV